jgi:UDP-N-acetylmuramoylalanine--D-glutamate ligase
MKGRGATVDMAGKTVLVLGLGETGLSLAAWLAGRGARVRAADTRACPPRASEFPALLPGAAVHLGGFPAEIFEGVDLIAISPGVPLDEPAVAAAAARGVPIVGDVELFADALGHGARPKLIAITGTNGKTTVTALAGAMCRAAGLDCEVAGNIGPAVLEALSRRERAGRLPEAWVLELSSFQLESTRSLDADAASVLNLSEDHLDRHGSMERYAAAKARIFQGRGVQILNRDDPRSIAMASPGRTVVTFGLGAPAGDRHYGLVMHAGRQWLAQGGTRLIATGEMRLAGLHNAANALAALALCRALGLPLEPLLQALRAFEGLPHRVQLVGEANGVRFYDDSKGTNVGSTVAALAGLAGAGGRAAKVALIAGGEGKGQDFSPLAPAVRQAARCVVLIGRDAPLLERALASSGVPLASASTMEEAVDKAASAAEAGDAVLLSPACASFDMFRDYRHRGDVFAAAVRGRIDARLR